MQLTEDKRLPVIEGEQDLVKYYNNVAKQINEIDDAVEAGSESASKRRFTNDLVTSQESSVTTFLNGTTEQMDTYDPAKLAGIFYGIIRGLTTKYKETVDNWISEQVESQKPDTNPEVLTEEQKNELKANRTEFTKQLKAVIDMASVFGLFEASDPWPLPVRKSAGGKRGKRALSLFTWTIDGEAVDPDSPKGVSSALGYEKAADFTKDLRAQGIDTKNPPEEFVVELKGKTVNAVKDEVDDEDEDEEDPTQPASDEDDADDDE